MNSRLQCGAFRSTAFVLFFALAGAGGAGTAAAGEAVPPAVDSLRGIVEALADSSLAGRGNGSGDALRAASLIATEMERAGLRAAGDEGWYQDFPLSGEAFAGLSGRNVLGLLPGSGDLAGGLVVVGAHYDHLGRADDGRWYAGADDNASGVAALLRLATELVGAPEATDRRGILFVAFAGEEIGLLGSTWFVKHRPAGLGDIDAMLNLDTVGRLRENRLYIGGAGTGAGFEEMVAEVNAGRFETAVSRGGWDASDHVAFNAAGIPVLFVFTGPHADYHQPTDTPDRVNFDGLARIADFARDIVAGLAAREGEIVYEAVAGPPPRPRGEGNRACWFGSIPDFSDEVCGLRLAGVIDGGPAAAAGLERGDLLLSMAGEKVDDLVSFTRILRGHEPGDAVVVEYQRGEDLRTVEVVIGNRADR